MTRKDAEEIVKLVGEFENNLNKGYEIYKLSKELIEQKLESLITEGKNEQRN